jgi:hypothetical protein
MHQSSILDKDCSMVILRDWTIIWVPWWLSLRAGEVAALGSNSSMEAVLRHREADNQPQGSEVEVVARSDLAGRVQWKCEVKGSAWRYHAEAGEKEKRGGADLDVRKKEKGGGGPVERDVERSRMEPGGRQLRASSGNRRWSVTHEAGETRGGG